MVVGKGSDDDDVVSSLFSQKAAILLMSWSCL
jgi:hypothetical protein